MFKKRLILITAIAFSGILLKAQSSGDTLKAPERGLRLLADSSGSSDFLNSIKISGMQQVVTLQGSHWQKLL